APPAGAVVELQPPLRGEARLDQRQREETGVADGVARADEGVVAQRPLIVDRQSIDEGGRTHLEGNLLPRAGAHVAFLAGSALLEGRRGAILLPNRLQLDTGVDLDLVAGDAELRLLD